MECNQLWIGSEYRRYLLAKKYTLKNLKMKNENSQKRRKVTQEKAENGWQKGKSLLELPEGNDYVEIFKALRLYHLKSDELRLVGEDCILPVSWIDKVYKYGYLLYNSNLSEEHKTDEYCARFGFELAYNPDALLDIQNEYGTSDFYFAGSKWRIIVGVGSKEEEAEVNSWFYCELKRVSAENEPIDSRSPLRNINKRHSVAYLIILIPSDFHGQFVYAMSEEVSLKMSSKDGGYWICRSNQLPQYLFTNSQTNEKYLKINFIMKHYG
eukprot:TRINITY_DN2389_c0_g1_i4.p1 TRINITY_DN2389_c0_g1~~TRINITY_DN2389_c0_g1_i4.p1  ORF type:complete len:268 (+),score=53.61 TRINITY_DN2389_c0_g1_i4:167-970(+)